MQQLARRHAGTSHDNNSSSTQHSLQALHQLVAAAEASLQAQGNTSDGFDGSALVPEAAAAAANDAAASGAGAARSCKGPVQAVLAQAGVVARSLEGADKVRVALLA
jgi:hypothetical protein